MTDSYLICLVIIAGLGLMNISIGIETRYMCLWLAMESNESVALAK